MIAYFKWAESSPMDLRKTLYYCGKEIGSGLDHDIHINGLDPGKSYTVMTLFSE
jgi:hypothetical protein